jgi:glycine cleavage system regulatory protein
METHSQPEPGSGTAIYTMHIALDVPAQVGIAAVRERLERIADELHIHIDLTPATRKA